MESVVVTLAVITNALRVAWSKDTSSDKGWSSGNPASGQCAVTTCIIQDYLGGEIQHTTATLKDGTKISHYYNNLNSADIDVTKQQFPEGTTFAEPDQKIGSFRTTREYCLSFPDTFKRYELLKSRVTYLIKDSKYIS